MKLLKLNHPVLGLCAQEVISGMKSYLKVESMWKVKYGRKFYECTLEVETSGKDAGKDVDLPTRASKPVKNVLTGEVYPSAIIAANDLQVSQSCIYLHCNRRLAGTVKYLVSWA